MSLSKKRTLRIGGTSILGALFAVCLLFALTGMSTSPTSHPVKTEFAVQQASLDQGAISATEFITPTGVMVADNDSDENNSIPFTCAKFLTGALLINPFARRMPVRFKRNTGRPFTAFQAARAEVSSDNNGGAKLVHRVHQNDLKLGTRRVRLSLTAGGAGPYTPVIFDFDGVESRTLTGITVGGTKGVNTEIMLRNRMGRAPFKIGRVLFQFSNSGMFGTLNASFIQNQINGERKTVPVDLFFLQNPGNYIATLAYSQPLDLIADGGLTFTCTLATNEVVTMGFDIPELVETYAMSS